MTTNHEFDRQLAGWLHETSAHRVPDHVTDVLLVTRATRQRRWWSSLGRWLPMDVPMRAIPVRWPNLGRVLLVAAILLIIAAAAILFAGSQRRLPPPFGPARNGSIAYGALGDIYTVDPGSGATPNLLIGGLPSDGAPSFSRDGAQVGFLRDTHVGGAGVAFMVADADGSNARQVIDLADSPFAADMSPDGSTIVVGGTYKGVAGVYLVATNGASGPRPIDLGPGDTPWLGWRPPNGQELVYIKSDAGDFAVYGAAPDGSGRRLIKDLGRLTDSETANLVPSLAPDGRSIVYAVSDGAHFHNHVLDLQTGSDRQLALGPADGHELHGTLSPDGTKLLFHEAGTTDGIQEMLAPIDGSAAAIPIGPVYPLVNGNADLDQTFSPDGRSILIFQGRDRELRLVDATTGGIGRTLEWQPQDLPGWQRLAP